MTKTVIGRPRIITENFDDITTYFGLIKCTVLPPRGLFHPVLPYRTQGKLMFPLCKACADTCNQAPCTHSERERAIQGTWCSVELEKALEKGYHILQMHEVWHFPETSDALFKDYVDTFLKIKQESSGYPKNCVTKEQKQQYVDEYLAVEGIQLDREKIEHNPGMRALSKLMLNSFWGKFAQRSNMAKVELIKDPQVYFDYLSLDEINVLVVRFVSDEMVELRYEYNENFVEPNARTNVVIAAFTTAYARLKLYEVLDQLQERVLYYDTDSVIFVSKPNEPEPPLGPYLGQLTNKLKEGHITTFISGGPKNYCYKTSTNKVETKIRGITLNCTAMQKVNFDVIRSLVYLHAKCNVTGQVTVDIPLKITRNTRTKNIETKRMRKDYRIVYDKRFIVDDYKTLPYGVYYDPKRPGGFGGAERLYEDVKKEGRFALSRKEIREWLMKQDAYTLHKPIRRHFKRNRVIVGGIDQQWQMDLADMQSMQKFNDGYRYLLVCIDVFSEYAWVVPLKNKTGPMLVEAFKVILTSGRKPEGIMTDQGTEFLNKHFRALMKEEDIELYNTYNETKASVVERLIRTLKTKMWCYFTAKKTMRYVDILPDLIYSYNHSVHRSIKTKPVDVTAENEKKVWHTLYDDHNVVKNVKYKFKVGDQVRISKMKRTFEKGYLPNFSKEIFTISKQIPRDPPVYKLKDLDGEELKGAFYEKELQKIIKEDDVYEIEKILKKRGRGNNVHYLVKWLGYPNKFNTWVPASEINKI
ncbi:uncharacterized transposon-derived [Paramuricea clavata]|uniref:DNA-directed DNA polymerase n=1 Tax=Paramuricea clavata TaxID=317549 RepID=A0A6S7HHH7_PARCT|nr:uncharacterized transposon-derived [Paramuricea clavata]